MSEWTQQLQDYWKSHCQNNSWKNVPLSVNQDTMKAFIEHIEYLDRLIVAYSLNDAIKIENLRHELEICKHASTTMAKLHDEKCGRISALESEVSRLKELLRECDGRMHHILACDFWKYDHYDNDFPMRKECTCGYDSLESRIQSALKGEG